MPGLIGIAVVVSGCLSAAPGSAPGSPDRPVQVLVGVASVSTMTSGADYGGEAGRVAQTGARAIRVAAKWNLIQPSKATSYDWRALDAAVGAAAANGLSVLMNLEGPAPRWALAKGADPAANGNPPARPEDFGTFAREVALRYGAQVSAWEIWNEPNLSHYLVRPTADTYVPLLKAAYTALRASGVSAPVITGGTSSSRDQTRDITFIKDLYRLGAQAYFDGIGVHPYTFPHPIDADPRGDGDGGGAAVLNAARATMVAAGDGGKSVWITEYGQPTGTTAGSVDELGQAQLVTGAVRHADSVPWIAAIFLFNSQDLTADKRWEDGNFGLFRYNGSPKPVVPALRALFAD